MYVPVGQRGQGGGSAPSAQQQLVAQQGAGIAGAIRSADASLQAKKKEARRIYERSQNMMREDLNTVAGFDIAAAGPDAAPALTQAANELKAKIREANDPVEAQSLIAEFTQKYDFFKNRETQLAEERKFADTLSVADRATRDNLNAGLEVGMEYQDIDASTVAQMDQSFRKEIVYQDGQIMVQTEEGLIPFDEAPQLMDFSAYIPQQQKTDIGDLQTSAMNEAVQGRILARGGGVFKAEEARKEYNTLTENSNRNGQALRLQILEDYVDTGERAGGFGLEGSAREGAAFEFFEPNTDQPKAWQLGPNSREIFQGSDEDWNAVWGDDGSGWRLIDAEREKFVEYARTKKDIDQKLKEKRLSDAYQEDQEESNYVFAGLGESGDQETGPQPESALSYSMTAMKEPIKVEASMMADGGDYEIHGFGIDPRTGDITARIFDVVPTEVYKYMDEDNKIRYAPTLQEAQEKGTVMADGRPVKFDDKTPRTITIGPGDGDLGNEVYNRIFGVDPATGKATNAEAFKLLEAHRARNASAAWSDATNQ
jgi:hypothetical protein|tara:strand:- start:13731 stop:15350 length:1620 start_codon:yes stop_codon:yes gene_type:complete